MAKVKIEDRLGAAMAWASLSPHERNVRRYRARKSTPLSTPSDSILRFMTGPTKPVRLNSRLIALAACAWPDAATRKIEISKLIVIAALDVIQKRLESNLAQ